MKKRIFSRVLALFMALSMLTTTVFAASFDDLQAAIDGTGEQTEATTPVEAEKVPQPEPTTPDTPEETPAPADDTQDETEPPAAPERTPESDDTHKNGALVRQEELADGTIQNYFGYGWSSAVDENQNKTWYYAIEAHDEQGNRYVVLLDDVSKGNGAASGVVIGQDGKKLDVTIDMNGHSITGEKDSTVITVNKDAELNLNNGTISGGQIGIDVFGTLFLDTVTVTNNGTGVKINDGGRVTFNGDNNKADVELKVGEKTYKVDADTAEALMKEPVATGTDWMLVEGKNGNYIVAYTGNGTTITWGIVNGILNSKDTKGKKIIGFAIPNGITSIGANAFKGRYSLESINIPEGVTSIGENAFYNCKKLKSLTIPATVNELIGNPFGACSSLESLTILGSVQITRAMFSRNKNLKSVTISENVKGIGLYAFGDCTSLEKLVLPKNATFTIGNQAFVGCSALTGEISIPEGVTSIGEYAFKCTKLESVSIPEGVTSIGKQAFYGCEDLKTVTIPASITTLGDDVLTGSGVKSVWISSEDGSAETAALVASQTDVNIFVKDDNNENLTFYRGEVTADFGNNADNSVNLDDGSVVLTNVSGTIKGEREVTLPNVAGITASIDTDGKIIVNIPAGGEEYPYGATITVDPDDPDGKIEVKEQEAPDLPVISFDFDEMTADTDTTIDDQAVPLAGLISRAQLVSYLYAREGSPDGEDAEDEYTLAWAWGVGNEIVDEEDDPEEIVTVAIFREIMTSYAELLNTTFDVVIEDEDDMPLMNCDEILAEFYASLKSKAA